VIGIALPVLDQRRLPIAAVTVVIPAVRASARHRQHVHRTLLAAARSLETEVRLQQKRDLIAKKEY
jgi:DNA-binding IclR family transcriptional regulator